MLEGPSHYRTVHYLETGVSVLTEVAHSTTHSLTALFAMQFEQRLNRYVSSGCAPPTSFSTVRVAIRVCQGPESVYRDSCVGERDVSVVPPG